MYEFVRLLKDNGTWNEFESDWMSQCNQLDEDFDSYAEATFSVVRELIEREEKKAGVFSLKINGKHVAMCQVNCALLPGYEGPVLRVRYLTLSPELDLSNAADTDYVDVLHGLLKKIIMLSQADQQMRSKHIKFHLRSPADQQFFKGLGIGLDETNAFASVAMRGAWLYITQK